MEQIDRISNLVIKKLKGNITTLEEHELETWASQSAKNRAVLHAYSDPQKIPLLIAAHIKDKEQSKENLKKIIPGLANIEEASQTRKVILFSRWKKWVTAAAAIFILVTGGLYFLNVISKHSRYKENASSNVAISKDLLPGKNSAILTLSSGRKILLDSLQGIIALQGQIKITNSNGLVVYNKGREAEGATTLNTLTTGRGNQYAAILPDGSKAWLNSGSSITFPTTFNHGKRQVSVTGEVYFEVIHDASSPFTVKAGNQTIEDIGTSFNVNAYDDENVLSTTLVEGSVRIISKREQKILIPGQQAQLGKDNLLTISTVDTQSVTAWQRGLFQFKDSRIEPIMREVARWYNVEISYEGKIDEKFFITIPRNVPVSKIFKILEATGGVHFSIENSKIIVKS